MGKKRKEKHYLANAAVAASLSLYFPFRHACCDGCISTEGTSACPRCVAVCLHSINGVEFAYCCFALASARVKFFKCK
jgi:hypothetical protein